MLGALPFDFAVLDVNLPDGFGTELLKDGSFSPDTAVIIVTAHGGVNSAVEAMRLGASDYLVKPFETEELPLALNAPDALAAVNPPPGTRAQGPGEGRFLFRHRS